MVVNTPSRPALSLEAFYNLVAHPDNTDHRFEYIAGRAIKVTSNTYASKLAMLIASMLFAYLAENDIGHVTGADGGYQIGTERYIPDVAFIAYTTQSEVGQTGYNPQPPDLAIEVISNPDNAEEQADLRIKISNYLAVGTIVWVFNWGTQQAEVHTPGQPVSLFDKNGVIRGGDILPGFNMPLADLYKSTPRDT